MNSKHIGDISESQVIAYLIKQGKKVLIPFGDNCRYDLIIEDQNKYERVQVKTGHLGKNGDFMGFCCSSTYGHRGKQRKSYQGEIDSFYVYCQDSQNIYRIPIEVVGDKVDLRLRIKPTRNNQTNGIIWANNYLQT